MNNDLQLFPIAMKYIVEGMTAEDNIYYYYNDRPILLIKQGTLINEYLLSRVKKVAEVFRNVYVSREYYVKLRGEPLPAGLRQEYLETMTGYDTTKEKASHLVDNISKTGEVSAEESRDTVADISQKINTIDAALLIQCISGQNKIEEYLYTHSANVAMLNGLMGKWMRFPQHEIDKLVTCGLLHDVGKTMVPPEILNAPRKLDKAEFEIVKTHTLHSFDILLASEGIDADVAVVARHHHEKMNGSGYPDGLAAERIPLYSRITAVSDVYDAMVSARCYKEPNSPFDILEQLASDRFSDLDIALVNIFLEHMPSELTGKPVLLSDGSIGTVRYVDKTNWRYPIVDVDGRIFTTTDKLYCVAVTFMP